jgi:hypothetical protein
VGFAARPKISSACRLLGQPQDDFGNIGMSAIKHMREHFQVEAFPHNLNISSAGSNLRVQFQIDPRYGEFVERLPSAEVLGCQLPVAAVAC